MIKIVGDDWLSCYLMTEEKCSGMKRQIISDLSKVDTLHMEVGQTVAIDRTDHSCAVELFDFLGMDEDYITPIFEYVGGAS